MSKEDRRNFLKEVTLPKSSQSVKYLLLNLQDYIAHTQTHTHTHIYIYIYVCMCVCVCVCVCAKARQKYVES